MGLQRCAESFFERRDRLLRLARMVRAGAHMGKANLLEKLSDRALVIDDTETLR